MNVGSLFSGIGGCCVTERLWAFVVVASFYGGTVFERKWWRWRRGNRSIVIDDHDLAEDVTFVSDVQRAIITHCERRGSLHTDPTKEES